MVPGVNLAVQRDTRFIKKVLLSLVIRTEIDHFASVNLYILVHECYHYMFPKKIDAIMTKLFSFEVVSLIYTGYILEITINSENKVEIRTYIKSRTALHISPKDIYSELNSIYGNSVVSFMTVCRWAKKIKGGLSVI